MDKNAFLNLNVEFATVILIAFPLQTYTVRDTLIKFLSTRVRNVF